VNKVGRTQDGNLFPKRKLTRADTSVPLSSQAKVGPRANKDLRIVPSSTPSIRSRSKRLQRSGQLITAITYPNGDKFQFGYDLNGRLIKIDGLTTCIRRGDKWYQTGSGDNLEEMEYHDHLLLENGDLMMQTGDNRFHGRRPDGTVYDRRLTALGAWSQTDGFGRVEVIVRPDGSSVFARYYLPESAPVIEEVSSDQKHRLCWKRDGDDFVCDGQTARHKLELTSNGNLSFIQGSSRVIITGDGITLSEPITKKRYSFDEEGRVVQIDYGSKIRQFSFIEKTRKLRSVAVYDASSNSTFFHERLGESNQWSIRDHHGNLYAPWYGVRYLTANADYVYQERTGPIDERPSGISHVCRPDGSEFKDEAERYPSITIN
jgi:hypothetical protein